MAAGYRIVPINALTAVTVEGEFDLASSRALLLAVARDAGAAGSHLLFDLRGVSSDLSFPDVFALVGVLADHPEAFACRIAMLDDYDDRFEKTQFFEASATEYGFNVRAFLDEAEAIAWLEAAPPAS